MNIRNLFILLLYFLVMLALHTILLDIKVIKQVNTLHKYLECFLISTAFFIISKVKNKNSPSNK